MTTSWFRRIIGPDARSLEDGADARRTPRAARLAVATVFFTNGALFANVVVRYPEVKDGLGVDNTAFGAAVAAYPLGALAAGLGAAFLVSRLGSARVATVGVTASAAAIAAVAFVEQIAALALVLFVAGALDAVIDVGQNAHGLRVQRRYGRSIVNVFHGVWSIGAVTGGLMGSFAVAAGVSLRVHLVASGVVFALLASAAARFMLAGADDRERSTPSVGQATSVAGARPRVPRVALRAVAVFGLLAACGGVIEDAGASWSAIYLRDERGASGAVAGLGFVALQAAMTLGRLLGDRAVDRFGHRVVVSGGGMLAAMSMGGALLVPTTIGTLAGFALAGLGTAVLVPSAMHAADELPGLPAGLGLAAVSWILRIGFVLSPPLVGAVADATGLRVALAGVVLAGATVAVAGRRATWPARPSPAGG